MSTHWADTSRWPEVDIEQVILLLPRPLPSGVVHRTNVSSASPNATGCFPYVKAHSLGEQKLPVANPRPALEIYSEKPSNAAGFLLPVDEGPYQFFDIGLRKCCMLESSIEFTGRLIKTRDAISKFIHGLSWLTVVLAVIATAMWLGIVLTKDGVVGVVFLFVAPFLSGGSLMLADIPSGVLYFQKKQRRDWSSLWLSGCSCLSVAGEMVILGCFRISAC